MSYRRTVYTQRQAITRPTGSGGLGPLLETAGPDRRKILSETAVRLAIVALVWFLQHRSGRALTAVDLALLVVYAGFLLWPLLHWRDALEFHVNGLRFKGEDYPFNGLAQVTWSSWKVFFTDAVRLQLQKESLNVTYIQEVQAIFTRCYTDNR